jgi:alpha-L-fucosidase
MNRRDYLLGMGATAGALVAAPGFELLAQEQQPAAESAPTTSTIEDRNRRMKWWHEAKFGMFIHWGLYSVVGRH